MKRKILRFIKYMFLFLIVLFLFQILLPKSYDVPPLQKRAGTQFWNLSTGSKIGYTLVSAKGKKKPYAIIYLHGGPGGHITDRNIKMLSPLSNNGYDVYLYDQIGSGQSGRLKDIKQYTVERHIRDLEEIIKKAGTHKVILIGQSWGAILAVLFTANNPDKVEKLIFTSPGPVFPVRRELANIKAPDSFHLRNPVFTNAQGNEKANNIRTKVMKIFATIFGKQLAPDKEADDFATYLNFEVNKSTVCDTSKILPAEAGGGFYAAVMTFESLVKVQDPRPKIKNLKISGLVMKGQCDNQKWGFTNEYLTLFPNHQLAIIPNAGHFISVEQPALYINTIQEFVNK